MPDPPPSRRRRRTSAPQDPHEESPHRRSARKRALSVTVASSAERWVPKLELPPNPSSEETKVGSSSSSSSSSSSCGNDDVWLPPNYRFVEEMEMAGQPLIHYDSPISPHVRIRAACQEAIDAMEHLTAAAPGPI